MRLGLLFLDVLKVGTKWTFSVLVAASAVARALPTVPLAAGTISQASQTKGNRLVDTNVRLSAGVPILAGAFYFGVFNPDFRVAYKGELSLLPPADQNRPNVWWYGVEDFFLMKGNAYRELKTQFPNYETSHLKPLSGYHDNSNPAVLEQQIRQAYVGGLDYFNFYWYWSANAKNEFLQTSLKAFKAAPSSKLLKFHLTLYFHPWDANLKLSAADTPKAVSQIIEHFRAENYLRINDRPVLSVGDGRGIKDGTLSDLHDLLGYIRAESIRSGVGNPILLLQVGAVTQWPNSLAEGFQCLVPNPELIVQNGDYDNFVKQNSTFFAQMRGQGRPFSPCVASGFDERPRYKFMNYDLSSLRFFSNSNARGFETSLQAARESALASTDPVSRMVNVYAWNEWHEGGIIEPSVKQGSAYLNLIEKNLKSTTLTLYEKSDGGLQASFRYAAQDGKKLKSWTAFLESRPGQNRKPVYECVYGSDLFLSLDANCEGQSNANGAGIAAAYLLSQPADVDLTSSALFRCNQGGLHHFISDKVDCSEGSGQVKVQFVNEGQLGFAL